MNLIGFCGPAGVGKSTLAKALSRECWDNTGDVGSPNILSFAATLRDMVVCLLENLGYRSSEVREYVFGANKEVIIPELGVTPRRLMQTLGTEWGRDIIKPTIWTDIVEHRVRQLKVHNVVIIIDDVRFQSEQEMIKRQGGVIVHLTRTGVDYAKDHPSAMPPSFPVDFHLYIDDTAKAVQSIMENIINV